MKPNSLRAALIDFYGCIDLRVIYQNAHRITSCFPTKIRSTVLEFNPWYESTSSRESSSSHEPGLSQVPFFFFVLFFVLVLFFDYTNDVRAVTTNINFLVGDIFHS